MNRSALHKKLQMGRSVASLALLLVMLTTGCQQNPTVVAKTAATPTPKGAVAAPVATPAPAPAISPERLAAGKKLIVSFGCVGCHTIDTITEARGVIGPNLTHVATRAVTTIASPAYKSTGKATVAREYLKESVLSPSTYLSLECPTGPCPDFVMPRDFKTRIKADELETLLDLLSTLK